MGGKLSSKEAKFKEAINHGTISKQQLERGIKGLLENEISQNQHPAKLELLDICYKLLAHLQRHPIPTGNSLSSLSEAKKKLEKANRIRHMGQITIRAIAIAAIIIIVGTIVDIQSIHKRLYSQPTADEQQYAIVEKTINGQFISTGLANGETVPQLHNSTEIGKAAALLEYSPQVPTWLPNGWEPLDYYASTSSYLSVFRIQYRHAESESLIKYTETKYKNVETAYTIFEQSKNGNEFIVENQSVYIAQNIDNSVAVWLNDSICYSLSGPIDASELLQIINSLKRRENNE